MVTWLVFGDWAIGSSRAGLSLASRRGRNFVGFEEIFGRRRLAIEVALDFRTRRYSITWSAIASTVAGTSRPRALAVSRLTDNSNLVGNCTGRSPGFSPLRMRSI